MKRLSLLLVLFLFAIYGCSSNKDETQINEEEALEDEFTEVSDEAEVFDEASVLFVPREELPEWLNEKVGFYIEDYAKRHAPGNFVQIKKGEWKERIVYTIEIGFGYSFEEASYRNVIAIYYENGERPPCNDETCMMTQSESIDFREKYQEWEVIFLYYGDYWSKSFVSKGNSTDKYIFPDISGMNNWDSPTIVKDRLAALQIPDAVLVSMTTEGLVETCLEFPYMLDILFYGNYQNGVDALLEIFNGYRELMKRPDLIDALIEKYYRMSKDVTETNKLSDIEKGRFSYRHFVLEFMMAQDVVVDNLNEEQERSLFLHSLTQQKIKTSNQDIFSGLNEIPTALLYAKKIRKDNPANDNDALNNFIMAPYAIDRTTINSLNDYVQNKYLWNSCEKDYHHYYIHFLSLYPLYVSNL